MSRIPLKQLKQSGAVDFNVARYNSTTGQWEPAVELASAPTIEDKSLTPAVTSGDESSTGLTITSTPQGERYVTVIVNGISYEVGDGYKTFDCYFSDDGGTTARNLFDVEAGDTLYWNGTIAGFDLSGTDRVDFDYDVDAAGNPEVLAPHAYRHEDGGDDELTVQNLGSGAATAGHILRADGSGGWAVGSLNHAATHADGGADELTVQNLGSGGASSGQILEADGSGGWNVVNHTAPSHAASHSDGGSDEITVQDLGSGAASAGFLLQADGAGGLSFVSAPPPGAHASTHADGGSDEITVQDLGSGAAGAGSVLQADGAGGLAFAPFAHAATHEQGGADELTAQNLGSGSAPDGYVMVADGLGGWNVEEQSGGAGTGIVVSPIVAGLQSSGSTTPSAVGATVLNPSELGYPAAILTLEVVLQVTNSGFDGYFELFSIDDGYAVVHDEISTNELTPTLLTATLSIGTAFNIDAALDNLLEGRVYLASGAGAGDRVICKYAAIRSKPI